MADENIKQHFRPDEAPFIDQVDDWLATCENEYRPVLTEFLNPRQRYIARTMTNRRDDVRLSENGGWSGAEMQRLLFYPTYYQPEEGDFELQLIDIDYPLKFTELHHRQILGTLLSKGLKRSAFGDILHDGDVWQVVLSSQMAEYVRQQVTKIGRINVKMKRVEMDTIVQPETDWDEFSTTVASQRLDSIVAAGFNYSRNRAKTAIEHGLVRVNWETIDRPDYPLSVHDLMSVRHAGRIYLKEDNGITKKGKQRVTLAVVHA